MVKTVSSIYAQDETTIRLESGFTDEVMARHFPPVANGDDSKSDASRTVPKWDNQAVTEAKPMDIPDPLMVDDIPEGSIPKEA